MKHSVIIYESSSFGGCYKYAVELFKAYSASPEVINTELLLPTNSAIDSRGIHKILLRDKQKGNKLLFLWRHFINPLILFFYLRKKPKSFVLLNDFEQLSAPLWAPLYRLFLRKHIFGVFLHDANRDDYPPSHAISAFCMNQIMKTVKIALYHGSLPEKSYYQKKKNITYLSVEHGLYSLPEPDPIYLAELKLKTAEFSFVLSIPGNIRPEKNYKHVIQCLTELPRFCLIIAGSPANSKVNIQILKDFAFDKGVTRQVIWIEKFLSEAELAAVIKASDLVVLYYAASFQAQSGILHQVIPLKKPVLVSDLPNALTDIVRKFGIGYISEADNPEALLKTLSGIRENPFHPDWEKCINDISWNKQVERVLEFLHDDL